MCMENALLTFSLIHGFRARFLTSFAQHPPALFLYFHNAWPLCVHHDLFLAARNCLHLFQRLACIMERSVALIYFLWGQKWIVAFRCGTFVCFDYNIIKVLWLTSNRCWADVGRRHQPNVEATLGRHRTADIDPTSVKRRPNTCSRVVFFFHSIICQNYSAPKSPQYWKQWSILVQSWHGYRPTVYTLTWKLDSY